MKNKITTRLVGLLSSENKHGNEQILFVNIEEDVQLPMKMKTKNEGVNC
jgi:hypothetical protein